MARSTSPERSTHLDWLAFVGWPAFLVFTSIGVLGLSGLATLWVVPAVGVLWLRVPVAVLVDADTITFCLTPIAFRVALSKSDVVCERVPGGVRFSSRSARRLPLFKKLDSPQDFFPRQPRLVRELEARGFSVLDNS